jgi:N-acetylglucosamine kinase-like BadF-type ATPase
MGEYFLGVDIGGTKSHALIADASGRALGFGEAGAGNWEDVGFDGMAATLAEVTQAALADANISRREIRGAGFGIAGYDWESQRAAHLDAIRALGLENARDALVNDTLIGLLAGAAEGWGIAIVAGTRANCWGMDQQRRVAHMTGYGTRMAEGAGAVEMLAKAVQAISLAWSRRGPPTRLTKYFIEHTHARDEEDLIEGLSLERIVLEANAAPLIFRAAKEGDVVALEIVLWAGRELGSLAVGVIRQLNFEARAFDAVMVGSLYRGSPLLVNAMEQTIHAVAPGARLVALTAPPVIGGVLLGMEQGGVNAAAQRERLIHSTSELLAARRGNKSSN